MLEADVSRHVRIDPGGYELLGLYWDGVYLDTCLPFGICHGSQIFQQLSDALLYVMRQKGYRIIDYMDDYIRVALPSIAFDALVDVMHQFGLTISKKKLVSPSTQIVCLGVLINSEKGTIQIPSEKLLNTVHQWKNRTYCSKRQLQSLLGLLLFLHGCVKPALIFINRMLMTLCQAHMMQRIELDQDFKRDLKWFEKFLHYTMVSHSINTKLWTLSWT